MIPAVVVRAPGEPARLEEIELLPPGPGQVRVKIAAAGVCHSDLSLARGTLKHEVPLVLGHEGAGTVVETGSGVTGLSVGDPVVLTWSPACRQCWFCAHGEPYLCANATRAQQRTYARLADGTALHPGLGVGAFAAETVLDASACVPLPSRPPAGGAAPGGPREPVVPLAEAALLGCAVLTGVGAVRHAARVAAGESVVVIGLGGVGLCAVQGARLAGADPIIAVDPAAAKAELALRLGATDALTPGPALGKEVRALTGGRGADHAIECVGRAETIRTAWSVTRRGGRATVVGLGAPADEVTFNALELAFFARTLAGCMYGNADPAADIPVLLADHQRGGLDLGALVTRTVGLSDVESAFARMAAGTGARTLILPAT